MTRSELGKFCGSMLLTQIIVILVFIFVVPVLVELKVSSLPAKRLCPFAFSPFF